MAMAYETSLAAVKPSNSLQSVLVGFDPLLDQIEKITERASICADRLNGGRPPTEGINGAKDAPEPSHLIWQAQARRDRLARLVERLATEIGRIDGGLS